MMADHERIWLQNAEDAEHCNEARMWCQDKVWPADKEDGEPTEYVRADLLSTARTEARKAALEEAAKLAETPGVWRPHPDIPDCRRIATAIRARITALEEEGKS